MPETGARPKWEYCVADIHARHSTVLQEKLREYGADGWELVFMSEPVTCEYRCVFRRAAT